MRRLLLLPVSFAALAFLAGCGGSASPGSDSEIAFVTSRDGDYAIYGMRADGSGQKRLTENEAGDGSSPRQVFFQVEPAWSPDGSRIAFASRRDGQSHIYVMRADGSGTAQLTSGQHEDSNPSWSPDGKHIAFGRDGKLFTMAPSGSSVRQVITAPGGEESDGAWAPDGRWLAYVYRAPGFTFREIWRVRPDGTDRQRVTRLNMGSYGPAWSPDGDRIAFSSNAQDGRYQLYSIGAAGKGLRRLTFQPGEYFDPSWSPDGKVLLFERDGIVYSRNAGGAETALTEGPNDGSPAWRPVQPESSGY